MSAPYVVNMFWPKNLYNVVISHQIIFSNQIKLL